MVDFTNRRFGNAKPDELRDLGRALYQWLNENERFADALDHFPDDNDPVALAITAPEALRHLPWETLHDGTDFLVVRGIRPVIPVRMTNPRDQGSPKPANRPLRILFMATSPEGVKPVLDFEKEEGDILAASRELDSPVELLVEESGSLTELGKTVKRAKRGAYDVVHLTGHANLLDSGPVFLVEDDDGKSLHATPKDLARALEKKPGLVFLSGCRTAESELTGAVRSFSEQLIEAGAPAVLGWARPVMDVIGIAAARALYQSLGVGDDLFSALVQTYRAAMEGEAELSRQTGSSVPSNWHLLRLFAREHVPGALVTSLNTKDRELPVRESFIEEFTDVVSREIRAISRERFVGRRRLLQRCLKSLKGDDRIGVVLHGLGGNGKTCVAARLCDRLGGDFTPIVVVGRLKESDLIQKMCNGLLEEKSLRDILVGDEPLDIRLKRVMRLSKVQFLFVLDDFEQNYSDGNNGYVFQDGNPRLSENTRQVLSGLTVAVSDRQNARKHRVIVTSRFELDGEFKHRFLQEPVNGFRDTDLEKLVSGLRGELEAKVRDRLTVLKYADDERKVVENEAVRIAGGNARLLRWLYDLIAEPKVDLPEIFGKMDGKKAYLLENILAEEILKGQPESLKTFLGVACVYEHLAPRRALEALCEEIGGVKGDFDRAVAIGLLETATDVTGEPIYQVPKVVRNLLDTFTPLDEVTWHARAAELLYNLWWGKDGRNTIPLADELVRLARKGKLPKIAARVEDFVQQMLMLQKLFKEAQERLKELLPEALDDYAMQMAQARIAQHFGDGDAAEGHFEAGLKNCENTESRGFLLLHRVNLLIKRGKLEAALDCCRNELIPLFEEAGNLCARAESFVHVADILQARGDLDAALRILEEQLPVYEKLGDVRNRAITLGKVADIFIARGDLDEAMKLFQESIILREKIGDVWGKAVMIGKVADILFARGDIDEALRIQLEEQLPVYDKFGDVRSRAFTLGKVADIHQVRGDLDRALRIRQEEELPVFDKLGDVRERAVTLGKIADILRMRGDLDHALRILKEQLPVYDKLGDVISRAVTLVKISRVLAPSGRFDEALAMISEAIAIFERLQSPLLDIARRDFQSVSEMKNQLRTQQ